MTLQFSSKCQKQLQKLKKNNAALFRKVEKQLALFQKDSSHPSLRLHKLTGAQEGVWSISITMSLRMLFYYSGEDSVVFFVTGKHEEVYK